VTAYLFDFNGVLVDDEHVHFAAFRDVLLKRGIELQKERYFAEYLAFDDATAFRTMLKDAGKPHDAKTVRACVAQKLPIYLAAVKNDLVLFPGGFELLKACAERGPVAIVSGALRVEIELALQHAGVKEQVRTIVAADDVSACKPDPAGYLEALRRLRVRGETAIAIEDSLAGIDSAWNAGCAVVAVAHSYPAEKLAESKAALIVDTIAKLDVDRLDALIAANAASLVSESDAAPEDAI
jgi:beta-phosphoglucomutase-like phosphatase (HAD superfamily)